MTDAPAAPQNQNTALASINDYLTRKTGSIAEVLRRGDSGLDARKMARLAVMVVAKNPDLQKCHPATILNSLMVGAALGLDPTLTTGKFWLIPRWNSKMQYTECTPMVGYKGLLELALRHPRVSAINAYSVFSGEEFEVDPTHPTRPIRHKPRFDIEKSERTLEFVYVLCFLHKSRTPIWTVLSKQDVEDRRARGAAKGFSPWRTDYLAMATKSAIRAAIQGGRIPTREEMSTYGYAEQAVEDEADMRRLENLGVEPPAGMEAEEHVSTAEVTSVEHTPVPENRSKEPIDAGKAAKALWLKACEENSLPPDDAAELVRISGSDTGMKAFDHKKADPAMLMAAAQMLLKRQERPS